MFDRSGARIFYGVPLLREREWELQKKKKKKKKAFHLASSDQMLIPW